MSRPPLMPSPETVDEADRLHTIGGLTWAQVGAALGWSPRTLRLAVERAQREASR